MDTRYRERGYSVKFVETEGGSYLELFRNGKRIGEVTIGIHSGIGEDSPVQISIRRHPDEFP
jgi:hypothetical protein